MPSIVFNGKEYIYENGKYYNGVPCERDVEIPIILDLINSYRQEEILQVGNVVPMECDILDKYEVGKGIINADIRTYKSNKLYECIFSITTLEHVGWDENPKEFNGIIESIHNILDLLVPNGKLIFSVPIGYNTDMDNLFIKKRVPITLLSCIKRISEDNIWVQCSIDEGLQSQYFYPFFGTNASIIGVVVKHA